MQLILLIIHLVLAIALIIVVLLQRSEGGALGIGGSGGSGGGMSGFLSGRATANLLTRATAVIATLFIVTSLALAMVGGGTRSGSITDLPQGSEGTQQQDTTGGEQQNNGTTTPVE